MDEIFFETLRFRNKFGMTWTKASKSSDQ